MIISKCDVYVNFQVEKQEMLMIQKKAKNKTKLTNQGPTVKECLGRNTPSRLRYEGSFCVASRPSILTESKC